MVFPVTDHKADNKEHRDKTRSPASDGDADPAEVWAFSGKNPVRQREALRLRDGTLVSDLMLP